MSIFDTVGAGIGGLFGGIPGAFAGQMAGKKVGGMFGGGGGGDPYGGMSPYPTYIGMDPNDQGFNLAGQFGGPNAPLNRFADESMRNGPSAGTQFALKQNQMGANFGRDQARALASGMAKDANANLAMKGGLGAGASERINKYATNVGMDAANQVDQNAGSNRAGLLVADENARTGNLAQAAGLIGGQQQQRYGMAAGDMARKQGEFDRRNMFNMNNYNQQMAAWGAGKQADATANSGKK